MFGELAKKASLVVLAILLAEAGCAAHSGFVGASGKRFVLDGKPFFYGGANCYYLMVYAADPGLRAHVDEVLQECAALGLSVVRTWAFNDGATQWNALQTSPGTYQEFVFRGLDYVLHKADQLGLRLILPFVNNWDDYGGMQQYVRWAGLPAHDDFYTDLDCKTWYKNHISAVLNRVNTYSGRTYKNDPTVFAWELANEPRAQSKGVSTLNSWVQEMSTYTKSIDAKHMVAVGIEGFYSSEKNPLSWMRSMGTDFVTSQQPATVDFAVAHSWPDHWGTSQTATMNFLDQQIADAHTILNKPFVLEEFGKKRPVSTRDDWYQHWMDLIYERRAAGWNLWILYHDAYPDYDGFGVYYPGDSSTVEILKTEAARMKSLIPSQTLPSVGSVRSVAEGVTVYTGRDLPVTAVFAGFFYIEEDDRSAGICVESAEPVHQGDRVRVCGTVASNGSERCINASFVDVISTGGAPPGPLGMRVGALGGRPPSGWPGTPDAVGLYNVGLLVRVFGRVVSPEPDGFFLDDGSGVEARVYGLAPVSGAAIVTGIAGYEGSGQRIVRTRGPQDIQSL